MGVYKVSGKAEIDLTKMYEYGIEMFGLQQAQAYLSGMHTLFQILVDNASLGRDASEFVLSLKRFSYKSHTIFYLATDIDVLIVRVLHQSMDYENNL
ncbi:type II toxin-antitoxin system RelE/ParE family toxin [Flavivirga sp. 57AJ16]|uniref:type II toxin-antitoxin system RelE/ParE family toxin n=1 Tax=Flavivirga sp. 57AJ16 TaxID=3025307 RepID=UPI002365BF60|nr:type II toxin-antitoxin system RelE/ParE family toxin [Flavivirga sp. 57AJ16]MDD7885738.1 type II toxin-antitoxin system RelE/ParE family toxin [Flavivirga sp. 57AJ16]